jgi:hydrogenase maturation protease
MRILVAGIGNIFAGDDGFGVEAARRLFERPQRNGVKVRDFGIRGLDLAYTLTDGFDAAILIDAAPRGHAPGTVSVVEPDRPAASLLEPQDLVISAHGFDPAKALQMASVLGGCRRVLMVACEPQSLGGEEGAVGLSDPVAAAVEPTVATVEALIEQLLAEPEAEPLGEPDPAPTHDRVTNGRPVDRYYRRRRGAVHAPARDPLPEDHGDRASHA